MATNEESIFSEIYKKHTDILIDPDNLEPYLSQFPKEKKDLFDPNKLAETRVLITGITGFVGSNLAEKLVSINKDIKIFGLVRRQSVPIFPNIREISKDITLFEANLIDYSSLETQIKKIEPDFIFHLAAQSFVPTSFTAPIESVRTNIEGTVNLLEVLRKYNFDIQGIQIACSSEEYGLVYPNEIPINEKNPMRPQSPYAVSKIATEHYSLTYHRAYGLPIKITRGFNHTGPKRGLKFVTSVIASQIARIIKKRADKIIIGNPKPIRDFTDIRDMIQGYILAILKGKSGDVYNLGHGFGISIENLVKLTASLYNVSYKIKIDETRFRPAEVNILICDYTKAKKEIGYTPLYPITDTMKNIVNYYMSNDIFIKLLN
ncbi:MAG: GDP-mannose 4,6-dehydratase [Candidatus Helarchaeota archaeon]